MLFSQYYFSFRSDRLMLAFAVTYYCIFLCFHSFFLFCSECDLVSVVLIFGGCESTEATRFFLDIKKKLNDRFLIRAIHALSY